MTEENGDKGTGDGDKGGSGEVEKFTIDEFKQGKWRDAIASEEYATHESLASVKEFDNFAKNYVEAQKFISNQDKIPAPKKDWTHKEWADWNKEYGSKFGFPEDASGYDISKPEDFPKDLQYNADAEDFFRKQAHMNGLSKAQANKLWGALIKNTADGTKNVIDRNRSAKQDEWTELEKELGNAYEEKIKSVNNMINRIDEDGSFRKWMKSSGAENEAQLTRFALKLVNNFSEDSITNLPEGKHEAVNTPREAESKLNKIYNDPKHPFHDAFSPEHKDAVAEVERLFLDANPQKETKGQKISSKDLKFLK